MKNAPCSFGKSLSASARSATVRILRFTLRTNLSVCYIGMIQNSQFESLMTHDPMTH